MIPAFSELCFFNKLKENSMLNPIAWIKVNVEAFKFTYKRGMELMKQHPFEDTRV